MQEDRPMLMRVTEAEALRLARERLGLTQAEVARRIGVSTRTIQREEDGGDVLSSTWRALCRELGLEISLPTADAAA
jgi:transcriptional regulator with XRE-family HTH domain